MFCTKCGKEIKEGSKFCGSCGAAVEEETTEAPAQATQTEPKPQPSQSTQAEAKPQPAHSAQTEANPQPAQTQTSSQEQYFPPQQSFQQVAKNVIDPIKNSKIFDKENTDKVVNGMNGVISSIKYKFTSVKSDGPRTFTNHPFTQLGGALALIVYGSILAGIVLLCVYLWLGSNAFNSAGYLDKNIQQFNAYMIANPGDASSATQYAGTVNAAAAMSLGHIVGIDYGYVGSTSTASVIGKWDMNVYYFITLIISYIKIAMGIIACAYLVIHGLKLKNRSVDFPKYFIKGLVLFCVLGIIIQLTGILIVNFTYEQLFGSFLNPTRAIVQLCIYVAALVVLLIAYNMYTSTSIRLRTYMGTADYMQYNRFTKNKTAPMAVGEPVQNN